MQGHHQINKYKSLYNHSPLLTPMYPPTYMFIPIYFHLKYLHMLKHWYICRLTNTNIQSCANTPGVTATCLLVWWVGTSFCILPTDAILHKWHLPLYTRECITSFIGYYYYSFFFFKSYFQITLLCAKSSNLVLLADVENIRSVNLNLAFLSFSPTIFFFFLFQFLFFFLSVLFHCNCNSDWF